MESEPTAVLDPGADLGQTAYRRRLTIDLSDPEKETCRRIQNCLGYWEKVSEHYQGLRNVMPVLLIAT